MRKNSSIVCSGQVYFIEELMSDGNPVPLRTADGRPEQPKVSSIRELPVWANRPGVILSDGCEEDDILVAYMIGSSRNSNFETEYSRCEWYKRFSPDQVTVQLNGETKTVLCSHVDRVRVCELGDLMGMVTSEELSRIVRKVRESGRCDLDDLSLLCRPENVQAER